MKLSKIEFKRSLPSPASLGPSNLLIYDKYFEQNKESLKPIQEWLNQFQFRIGFDGGENLKDLSQFPEKIAQILNLISQMSIKNVQLVSFGGGSLGDFTGFAASVLKRGLPLVHIPTTWLAAVDSSHGGKTALNVCGFKNQIGSFYPADKIILVQAVLFQQPSIRSDEAYGEALKIALLTGKSLWKNFINIKYFDNASLWAILPDLIKGKYQIVKKDPYEKKGIRYLLNLGHTLGHLWEASQKLPHGIAVGYGIRAAIEFSKEEKIMTLAEYKKLTNSAVIQLLPTREDLCALAYQTKNAEEYLLQDKKISKKKSLRFIFIKRPGICPIGEISIEKLLKFHSDLQKEYRP